jgi:hypothetical protein
MLVRTFLAFYSDQQALRRARERLRPWVQRHRNAPRIRLLLRSPPGGRANDADILAQAIPEASFDVYASPVAAAEVSDYDYPCVHLHPIGARSVNWVTPGPADAGERAGAMQIVQRDDHKAAIQDALDGPRPAALALRSGGAIAVGRRRVSVDRVLVKIQLSERM